MNRPPSTHDLDPKGAAQLVAALALGALAELSTDCGTGDWDALFDAVKVRLRTIAGDPIASSRTGVLECVEALEQLHIMLAQERAGRNRTEQEFFGAQASLTEAFAELVDNLSSAPQGTGRKPAEVSSNGS
jgi:hypothetical protein